MAGAGTRSIPLPDGRALTIRPVGLGDVDGLAALYEGMTVDDLHNRFFSVYRPDRRFLQRVATVASRGGYGLVAVVPGEDGRDEVVAEAGYTALPNGDGELAIAVSSGWRGWLGPVLLDALIEAAAARGVANLEADVLATNTSMLALARSRGVATMPHDDWVSVRLLIGTAGRVPHWPGAHNRPRVLVEAPGGRWHAEHAGDQAGLQVLGCSGPRRGRTRCPMLEGRPCPLAAGADAIVVSHPPDDDRWRAIAEAHRELHPGVPVCVEPLHSRETTTPMPEGVTRLESDADENMVVAVVDRLARAHRARPESAPPGETSPGEPTPGELPPDEPPREPGSRDGSARASRPPRDR